MPNSRGGGAALEPIRRVSQIREYASEPVPDDIVDQLLELARWTGSSKNTQPWRFIVVRDKNRLRKISALRPNINWVAAAPLGIAIVLDGTNELSEAQRQIVLIGRPTSTKDPRPTGPTRGRKPIAELVSYDRWGASKQK